MRHGNQLLLGPFREAGLRYGGACMHAVCSLCCRCQVIKIWTRSDIIDLLFECFNPCDGVVVVNDIITAQV